MDVSLTSQALGRSFGLQPLMKRWRSIGLRQEWIWGMAEKVYSGKIDVGRIQSSGACTKPLRPYSSASKIDMQGILCGGYERLGCG